MAFGAESECFCFVRHWISDADGGIHTKKPAVVIDRRWKGRAPSGEW